MLKTLAFFAFITLLGIGKCTQPASCGKSKGYEGLHAVASFFDQAVHVYKVEILDKLATLTGPQLEDVAFGKEVVRKLNCDVDQMYDNLTRAEWGVKHASRKLDGKMQKAVASEAEMQKSKASMEQQKAEITIKLERETNKLADAERKFNDAKVAEKAALARLNRQMKKFNEAKKKCISGGKRRKRRHAMRSFTRDKRLFGKITKWVGDRTRQATNWVGDRTRQATNWAGDRTRQATNYAAERAKQAAKWTEERVKAVAEAKARMLASAEQMACIRLNEGGIKNARHARDLALTNLMNEQRRAIDHRSNVQGFRNDLNKYNQNIKDLSASIALKEKELAELKKTRKELVEFAAKAKVLQTRVAIFHSRTKQFKDAAAKMIEFDQVIGPMNNIRDHLQQYNICSTGITVDPATMAKITENLNRLQAKLPDFPFVFHREGCAKPRSQAA